MSNLPDFTSLSAVLGWLVIGGGAPYVVMLAFSYGAELFPQWGKFPRAVKTLVPIVLSVLIAFGASALLTKTELIESISPYWVIIVQVIIAWAGSQSGYMNAKRSAYGARFDSKLFKG